MNPGRGPTAVLARRLGWSEGRVCTTLIGTALALVLAVNAVPPMLRTVDAARPGRPVATTDGPTPPAAVMPPPVAPVSDPATPPARPVAPTVVTTTTSEPSEIVSVPTPPGPPRQPDYRLPPELRPLEAAVGNLVAEGCSRVGLVSTLVSFLPRDVPLPARDLLVVLTPLYLACGEIVLPEVRIVCAADRQVQQLVDSIPLLPQLLSAPPIVGLAVQLVTAPTDTVLGLLGLEDPLLKPLLMSGLDCQERPQ